MSDSAQNDAARAQIRESLAFILSLTAAAITPNPNQEPQITSITSGSLTATVIRGPLDLDSLSEKSGPSPASKASIDAMPKIVVNESEKSDCAICLDEFIVGGEAREMPCKHKFHSCCIEKWLEIHGSCPVCRFVMPSDGDGEGEGGRERRRVNVSLWFMGRGGGGSRDSDSGSGQETQVDDDGSETQDS